MSRTWSLLAALALLATGCSVDDPASTRPVVAFVMVGAADDLGYNQAVFEGSIELARRLPDLQIIRVENVPEDETAEETIRELVEDRGADLVFATSFGHLPYAYAVAQDHPDVVIVHQGGTEPEPRLHNFGTYFGSHWEAMYEAGVAAGNATQTRQLGFIAAFPIPATYANVNAFTLGAQRVQPDVTTTVAFTGNWCDPELQRTAVAELVDEGADVLALHQDCTTAVLEEAERAQVAGVVGYHADGSEVAETRWLAGAVWNWGDLYTAITQSVLDRRFDSGPFTGDFRGSIADDNNPFTLTQPGPSVGAPARAEMTLVRQELAEGITPFRGPLMDNTGTMRIPAETQLTVQQIDALDWFVAGVEEL